MSAYLAGDALVEGVTLPTGTQASNLACAIAVALVLGVEPGALGARLADLPSVDHRLQAVRSDSGLTILDDTYNSNPAGARAALGALVSLRSAEHGEGTNGGNRLVVVTPGMVELGRKQAEENRRFGTEIAGVADQLIIVGRTNRTALDRGAREGGRGVPVTLVETRQQAVDWVRAHLQPGDAVLYENDLPDHYP
jgi:UDP-N-acetylmuramoyl-tripeptide--D-alanyl-D-alanine ligase